METLGWRRELGSLVPRLESLREPLRHPNGIKKSQQSWLMHKVDRFFQLSERETDLKTEFLAGFICFTSNSCQLVIVPLILHNDGTGAPKDVYLFAFVVSTVVSSILVGVLSNLPLPAGVGSGAATYFAYDLTTRQSKLPLDKINARQTFGCTICFASSLLTLVLALSGLQWCVFRRIPNCVKDAMPVGLGLLLALSGFQMMELVVDGDGMLKTGPASFSLVVGSFGCCLTAFLRWKRWKTAVLVPLVLCALLAWACGADGLDLPLAVESPAPDFSKFLETWRSTFLHPHTFVDFETFEFSRSLVPALSFYLISLFDVGGVAYAVASAANVVRFKGTSNEVVPGAYGVFVAVGLGSLVAAELGCSPVIALGDAFVGVSVGGRTGLTAIFTSFFYLLALPLAPVFTAVPQFASAPVLVLLGVELLSLTKFLDLEDPTLALPSFCTVALMPYLYSIDHAILAGLACYVILKALKRLTCASDDDDDDDDAREVEPDKDDDLDANDGLVDDDDDDDDDARDLRENSSSTANEDHHREDDEEAKDDRLLHRNDRSLPGAVEHDRQSTASSKRSDASRVVDANKRGANVAYETYYANREGSTLVQNRKPHKSAASHHIMTPPSEVLP